MTNSGSIPTQRRSRAESAKQSVLSVLGCRRRGPAVAVIALIATALGGCSTPRVAADAQQATAFQTPYQVVLLSNGQSFIGKLQGFGTPTPVLTDVFYIQQGVKEGTKEVVSALIKRGGEWHGPDRMYLSATSIVFVEPVATGSQMAKLIEEQRKSGK